MKRIIYILFSIMFLLIGCNYDNSKSDVNANVNNFVEDWKIEENLDTNWKFSIGDNPEWAQPGFDDRNWDEIKVPSSWENEGFHGYNGYAWYRIKVNIPKELYGKINYLYLGYVDDVDQTFFNGHLIGSTGQFPPDYQSAYNIFRKYIIPPDLINENGPNEIAVRVYDAELEGGILRGEIGIYSSTDYLNADIPLEGYWKFKLRDSLDWKNSDYNDKNWEKIMVPGYWEVQGYPNYDGFAWYRKTVFVPEKYRDKDMVLVMGKIDDFDQTYVNGQLIGSTGDFANDTSVVVLGDIWQEFRGYYIPKNLLKFGQKNVIAVRVYDGFRDGGIYQGPVGLVTQNKYREYWNMRKNGKGILDKLLDK